MRQSKSFVSTVCKQMQIKIEAPHLEINGNIFIKKSLHFSEIQGEILFLKDDCWGKKNKVMKDNYCLRICSTNIH